MAHFEDKHGTVVARILYDGLGTAGKTQSLRKIREIFSTRSGDIFVPEERKGRTLYFDWLEMEAGRFDEHALRIELLTVPGQFAFAHRRWTLLRSSEAIITVIDSTPEGLVRATYAMVFLRRALESLGDAAPPLLVQAHKQDLPSAASVDEVRARFALPPSIPVIATSAKTGEGLRDVFVLALREARHHVRRMLDGRPAEALPRATSDPAELYTRMKDDERSAVELEGELVASEIVDQLDRPH